MPRLPHLLTNTISFVPNAAAAAAATGVRAIATVTSSTPDAVASNNTAILSNGFNAVQDLTVSIAGPTSAIIGSPVLYTVTTTNNGPSVNSTETTTVQLPIGLTGVEVRDNAGVVVAGAYSATTGVVTFATTTNVPVVGQSVQGTISFLAPDDTQLSLVAVVALTSPSGSNYDANVDNNAARISTTLVPQSLGSADLATTFTSSPAASLTPGSAISYTIRTTNNGAADAKNPVQLVSLPVGLSAASLTLGGATSTLSAGVITFTGGASYNVSTGLLTVPGTSTLVNGSTLQSTVAFTMPPATITVTATSASDNPDGVSTNNIVRATTTTTTTTTSDVSLAMSGPPSATSGAAVNYSVVVTNNGPSTASTVTVAFTLPPTVTTYTVNGTTSTVTAGSTVNLQPSFQTLLSGATLTYTVSFYAPTSTFTPAAVVTAAAGSNTNTGNDNASVKTLVNVAPVANDVVNKLQSPEGNTAAAGLTLTPLSATDSDGSVVSYAVTALPLATQGILYYNGTPATLATTILDATLLSFKPAAGFVGSVFFTYTAKDNGNGATADALTSAPARYTIPVGRDNSSVYTATPNKGGAAQYATNDVLAFVIDPNGAAYNSSGLVYNPSGTTSTILAAGGNNGLVNQPGSVVEAPSGSGPGASGSYPANPTNVLPAGVSLDATTGLIYVSNRALLVTYSTVKFYQLNVTTTDVNGGTNVVTAQFSIGAYPLPVELTAFTATAVNKVDASLAWTTASEKANDHFDIERSLNGTDYVTIGQVQGQGSKASPTAYALRDAGIGAKVSGLVYYRLRQVDTDGPASYSPVRSVSFTKALPPSLVLYPNPATTSTQLDLTGLPTGSYEVSVLDATGRVVLRAQLEAGLAHALELNTMASGTYLVRVQGAAITLTKRLIKE